MEQQDINNCPGRVNRDIGQMIVGVDMKLKSLKFDVENFRQMLVAAIVMHNLPLSFVEYKGLRALFSYFCPEVVLISKNTVKADLMKMYKYEKDNLKNMFAELSGRVCLMANLWTSNVTDGYLCIIVHFVNKDWIL
ncbi:zinc finger BED domain-containing protein DAYSLEEPER-like [Mercurialis annua]|uniref:zinc finger BED domain-containing protein DAYSLEEPER-like n=1 Tax=Mercurialis annua TaxID=3986 RepID=UPI00215E7D46|nr:zinc finger BED domain-containing protein DAYSLEEPER-like [Mercurialis annua]